MSYRSDIFRQELSRLLLPISLKDVSLTSLRGCGLPPPPEGEFFRVSPQSKPGTSDGCARSLSGCLPSLPHRIHSCRFRSTPAAAADSGSSASATSIHAVVWLAQVSSAIKASANEVRPEQDEPITSVIAPTGNPPPSSASISGTPDATRGTTVRCRGDNAPGTRCASTSSICLRIELAATKVSSLRLIFASHEVRVQAHP